MKNYMDFEIEDLDGEVRELVLALNRLPGIQTTGSCCGHGKEPYQIWFMVTDPSQRGLLTLSRLMSLNYYGFGWNWKIILDHMDVAPQLIYRLEGPIQWEEKEVAALVERILELVEDRKEGYNILLDRVSRIVDRTSQGSVKS